jgi:hypothetical protein
MLSPGKKGEGADEEGGSEDAKMLALSDAVMVSSTFLCVPFVKVSIY